MRISTSYSGSQGIKNAKHALFHFILAIIFPLFYRGKSSLKSFHKLSHSLILEPVHLEPTAANYNPCTRIRQPHPNPGMRVHQVQTLTCRMYLAIMCSLGPTHMFQRKKPLNSPHFIAVCFRVWLP